MYVDHLDPVQFDYRGQEGGGGCHGPKAPGDQ